VVLPPQAAATRATVAAAAVAATSRPRPLMNLDETVNESPLRPQALRPGMALMDMELVVR
jgi:hypothetical protein